MCMFNKSAQMVQAAHKLSIACDNAFGPETLVAKIAGNLWGDAGKLEKYIRYEMHIHGVCEYPGCTNLSTRTEKDGTEYCSTCAVGGG